MNRNLKIWIGFGCAACNSHVDFAGSSHDRPNADPSISADLPTSSSQPSSDLVVAPILIDVDFPAATFANGTTTFRPEIGVVEERLTLRERGPHSATFSQINRPVGQVMATQGNDGRETTEVFDVSAAGKLDLVVVIDDSRSMAESQTILKTGLQHLLGAIRNVDWRLVVGTSTTLEPCLRSLSDPHDAATPYPAGDPTIITAADYATDEAGTLAKFAALIDVGVSSFYDENNFLSPLYSGNERVLYGALRALDYRAQDPPVDPIATCKPVDWVRPNSAIAILAVTDEDNCHVSSDKLHHHSTVNVAVNGAAYASTDSTADACDANEYDGTTLLSALRTMGRTPGVDARFYAIYVRETEKNTCDPNPGSNWGWAYDQLIASTNGAGGSICDANFDDTLDRISQNVARIVSKRFPLTHQPLHGAVSVSVDDAVVTDFALDGTTLIMNSVSGSQGKLNVSYRYGANPKLDRIEVPDDADLTTVEVRLNQAAVPRDAFTFDSTRKSVVFLEPPPNDAKIEIRYRKGSLPTRFEIGAGSRLDPITVTVADQETNDFALEDAANLLTFSVAPADGAAITLTYRSAGDRITHYPSASFASSINIREVNAVDALSEEPLAIDNADGNLVFNSEDIVDGREVIVSYIYHDDGEPLGIDLADVPIEGSIQLNSVEGPPDCLEHFTLDGRTVRFPCLASDLGEVSIDYSYVLELHTDFVLPQPIPENARVSVYIDGVETTAFEQTSNSIHVPSSRLGPNSIVRIVVQRDPS